MRRRRVKSHSRKSWRALQATRFLCCTHGWTILSIGMFEPSGVRSVVVDDVEAAFHRRRLDAGKCRHKDLHDGNL